MTDVKVPESLRKLHGDIVSEVFLAMSKCIELEKLLNVIFTLYLENELTLWFYTIKSIS